MFRVDAKDPQNDRPALRQVRVTLVAIQLVGLGLNAVFVVLLALRYTRIFSLDWSFLVSLRLGLYLLLALVLFAGFLFLRRHRHLHRTSNGERGHSSSIKPPLGDPEDPGFAQRQRRWQRLEKAFAIYALAVTAISIVRWNVFSQFLSFGDVSKSLAGNSIFTAILDRAIELLFFLIVLYVVVKIPMTVGDLLETFDKFYAGRWRVHESVFGIFWVVVGAAGVFYGGDGFDRAFGVLYIIIGAIIVGRDYEDVRRLKFIQRVTAPPSDAQAGSAANGT